jgi:Cu/Ag efflux protein CusF
MERRRRATWFALLLASAVAAACARSLAVAVPAQPGTRIAGDVREIDLPASRLTLLDAGRLRVVELTPATVVRRGQSDSSIEELKKGDRVIVSMAAEPPYGARLIAVAGRQQPPRPGLGLALP